MNATPHEMTSAQTLIDRHFEIWNDSNPTSWAAKFADVYTPNLFVADYAGIATGYAEVAQLLQRVQSEHIGFAFTPAPVEWNHGVGRVTWSYGPADNPGLIRGEDIFTIEEGRLASLHVFIDRK